MQKSILAVSADQDFLEEIRSHLEEGGRFKIFSVSTGADALRIAENETFDAALLDAEISDIPFVPFTRDLIYAQPNLKLLIYPPHNNPHHPVIKGLVSHGFLNKPFFAPEVGSALAAMFNPMEESETKSNMEGQSFTELESNPIEDIRGDLQDPDYELQLNESTQVDDTIPPTNPESPDLFDEHFSAENSIDTPGEPETFTEDEFEEVDTLLGQDEFRELDAFLDSMPPPDPEETERLFKESELLYEEGIPEENSFLDDVVTEEIDLSRLLAEDPAAVDESEHEFPPEIPLEIGENTSPDGFEESEQIAVIEPGQADTDTSLQVQPPEIPLSVDTPLDDSENTSLDEEPVITATLDDTQGLEADGTNYLEALDTPLPPPLPPMPPISDLSFTPDQQVIYEENENNTKLSESISEPRDESIPGTSPLGIKGVRFEYSCVLIPKNVQQFIAGDLSNRIGFILPQIHMTNGWRVTSISVRPLYLMWRISLPASVFPRDAVIEIRKCITEHLYSNFPELLEENKDQVFWAEDYLVLSGAQNPSNSLIQEFIHRVRNTQQE